MLALSALGWCNNKDEEVLLLLNAVLAPLTGEDAAGLVGVNGAANPAPPAVAVDGEVSAVVEVVDVVLLLAR